MAQTVAELSEPLKKDLSKYAKTLAQYIDPEISQYSPIGTKRLPQLKRLVAERVSAERNSLQSKLNISWNWQDTRRWKLEMFGANENPGSEYCLKGFWWILPIRSEQKEALDYLAQEALPQVFSGKSFIVTDTRVPCGGDFAEDCR